MTEQFLINTLLEDNSLIDELSYLEPKCFREKKDLFEKLIDIYHDKNGVTVIDMVLIGYKLVYTAKETYTKQTAHQEAKKLFDNYQLNLIQRSIQKVDKENIDTALSQLYQIVDVIEVNYQSASKIKPVDINSFIEKIREIRKQNNTRGLTISSLPTFNRITGGILPTDLIGIYGKEKSSKTTLAHEIVLDLCLVQKKPIAVFNFEMDKEQLEMKTMSQRTGIDINALRNPKYSDITDQEFELKAEEIISDFENANLFIFDDLFDEYQIYSKTKELIKSYSIKLVVIDYLMLIEPKIKFKERREALNYLTRFFKRMAKKLNIAIILVSQANDSGMREAEAKGLSRDSNYYFYVDELKEGEEVTIGDTKYKAAKGDYVVINRGIRHGKGNRAFLTRFIENKYYEIDTYSKYGELLI